MTVYAGEVLNQCGIVGIDCSDVQVVAVSGDGPNVCGHLLLFVDSRGGYYFHIAELHGFPRYMNGSGYRRYLRESGKSELRRRRVRLSNPAGANQHLEELMAMTWTWGAVPNNCVAFVEDIIAAGGGTWSSLTNCPDFATADTLQERVQRFMGDLERDIYRLYRVPR